MHDKCIWHNDIKTDNILVEIKPNDVRIYFIDFGQATFRSWGILHFDEGDDPDDTDDYIAQEVRSGLRAPPKSDIFSLGVIFADIANYENTPIQIYRKFHLQKQKIFRQKKL